MSINKIKCHNCEEIDCYSPKVKVCKDAIKCYTSITRELDGTQKVVRGCVSIPDHISHYCSLQRGTDNSNLYFTECCDENMCNNKNFANITDHDRLTEILRHTETNNNEVYKITLQRAMLIVEISVCLIILLRLLYVFVCRPLMNCKSSEPTTTMPSSIKETNIDVDIEKSLTKSRHSYELQSNQNELWMSPLFSSTSKTDTIRLTNRTLVYDMSISKCLSKGNFGRQVWRGTLTGQDVAVTIFTSDEYESLFQRETEIYSKLLTNKHENVLNCIGWDTIKSDEGSPVQHWLVTQNHPNGSLHDYLIGLSKPLSYQQMFDFCSSITEGLLYLHTEISGIKGKPCMAHRNLTSKNIMMKQNGHCAIGEFGYAVHRSVVAKRGHIDLEGGSKRYMSPEILSKNINLRFIENFFHSDIYSLALILWEICRMYGSENSAALDYAAPYSEWLEDVREPTLDLMYTLVVQERRRPSFPETWHCDLILKGMKNLIEESWCTQPSARLTAMRIKKNLSKLSQLTATRDTFEEA